MGHTELFTELVIAVGAAFMGGLLARVARLPVIVGYIAGGIGLSFVAPQLGGTERGLATVAELGIALLLFIIGVELSLPQLLGMGRTSVAAGSLQILFTILLGVGLGTAFGYRPATAVVIGFAMALSSTAVVLKSLDDHGQTNTRYGQMMLGILIVQDLAVVAMLAVLPVIGGLGAGRLAPLLFALIRSGIFLMVAVLIASRLIPRLLNTIARSGTRELFALTVITLSFAAAYATYRMGFSVALGAFIAGVIVGESEYTHQVFADIAPVRDIFAAVFFVSVGATFRPAFLVSNAPVIFLTLLAVVVGKFIIVTSLLLLFRQHHKIAFLSGVGLAQIGEFSFLIAQSGQSAGAIRASVGELITTVTLLSILMTPLLISLSPNIYTKLVNIRWFSKTVGPEEPEDGVEMPRRMRDHVILLGYGMVGRLVGAGLHAYRIPYVVVDFDRESIARAKARNVPTVYGDAANPLVVKRADPKHARAVVVALPDTLDTWRAVRFLRQSYPNLPVIARAVTELDIGRLYAEGADEVVTPRFEAGLEILRHILIQLNVPSSQREEFIERMRHWELPHQIDGAG